MRRLWMFIYAICAIFVAVSGYQGLAPARTANINADWIFVVICFVLMCLFPVGAMAFGRVKGIETFRRPSLDRQPLGWWRDTLQPLRVSLVVAALLFFGACFALPHADHRGVMLFWVYAAIAVGLFIGERLVYVIYHKRIA